MITLFLVRLRTSNIYNPRHKTPRRIGDASTLNPWNGIACMEPSNSKTGASQTSLSHSMKIGFLKQRTCNITKLLFPKCFNSSKNSKKQHDFSKQLLPTLGFEATFGFPPWRLGKAWSAECPSEISASIYWTWRIPMNFPLKSLTVFSMFFCIAFWFFCTCRNFCMMIRSWALISEKIEAHLFLMIWTSRFSRMRVVHPSPRTSCLWMRVSVPNWPARHGFWRRAWWLSASNFWASNVVFPHGFNNLPQQPNWLDPL